MTVAAPPPATAGSVRPPFVGGWLVTADRGDGWIEVARDGDQRLTAPGAYLRLDRPGVPPAAGDEVAIAMPEGAEAAAW